MKWLQSHEEYSITVVEGVIRYRYKLYLLRLHIFNSLSVPTVFHNGIIFLLTLISYHCLLLNILLHNYLYNTIVSSGYVVVLASSYTC